MSTIVVTGGFGFIGSHTVLGWKTASSLDEAMASAWNWKQKIRSKKIV